MHSHVAPYPVHVICQALFELNQKRPIPIFFPLTTVVTLLFGGIPAFSGSTLRQMSRKFEDKMAHLSFQPSPTNRISKLVLSAWDADQPFTFEDFVYLCLWNTIFAHFPEGAKPGIAL